MKKIIATIFTITFACAAFAGGEMKEVCTDKVGANGKVVTGKDGKAVQVCKKIKVHKKLEGATAVPTK